MARGNGEAARRALEPAPVRRGRKPAPRLVIDDARVPLRDGIRLAADVIRPDTPEPVPALVLRTPYSRGAARQMTDVVTMARLGWAVVVQDVRGRFDSEGDFEPFHQERLDGFDTIGWAAAQPWCDGRVATLGASYLGIVQWLAAVEKPPALRAMAPLIVGGDVRDGWTYEGGALQLGLVGSWGLSMPMSTPGTPRAVVRKGVDFAQDYPRFFRLPPAANPLGDMFPPFRRWLDYGDKDYWGPLSIREAYHRIEVPTFQVAGWYDIFCESNLENFRGLRRSAATERARAGQRLVVGPWPHTGLYFSATAEFDFGLAANAIAQNLPGKIVEWLRDAVDGEEVEGGARVYVMGPWGSGEWRELDDWPPPFTPTTWYCGSEQGANSVRGDGELAPAPTEHAGTDRFLYDPQRPVPTRGGRILGPIFPMAGPTDQRPVEERDDVLVYTSPPLAEDLVIMGPVTATVVFATTGRSADITVKLCEVYPDGRSYNIVDSVRRVAFAPGRAKAVEVAVGSVAKRFGAGNRLRVEISSSNFPRFDRNTSTGDQASSVYESAVQTVHLGGRRPTAVTLPVVT